MFTVNAELHLKTFLSGNLMDVFEQNERFFLSSLLRGGALGNHFGKPIIIALPKATMQSWAAHPSMSAEDLP